MTKTKKGATSYKETAFGVIPRNELIPLEIEGIKKAWDFVLSEYEIQGKLPLTLSFVKKIHQTGFGWIFPKMGGAFRTIEVKVSAHQPPKAYKVPRMMKNFIEDLKVRMNHLSDLDQEGFIDELTGFLAWLHHQFLWIHPFVDYNGRMSRLLINIVLLNLNLPPIEMKVETKIGRKKYIGALQEADGGNYGLLKKLIQSALEEAAKEL